MNANTNAKTNKKADEVQRVAVIGCGVIGASWAALFRAAGCEVSAHDPHPDAERNLSARIGECWGALRALGLTDLETPPAGDDAVRFCSSAADAVRDADFVQESIPEQLALKCALYRDIESHLSPHAVIASSASGLMLSEMQRGWRDPSRFILAHPFNPPHIIPLVELLANAHTADGVLDAAERFYHRIGKVTIRVRREVPAHVANRLQAALWREAIHLVQSGVASVEDVDKAVWAGPGLRWAAMGPHMLFHLGAAPDGIGEFCERYRDSFHRWWDDLGDAQLNEETVCALSAGVGDESRGKGADEMARQRDALIVAMLRAMSPLR